jgi:mono/diheme cytochrome c family protein
MLIAAMIWGGSAYAAGQAPPPGAGRTTNGRVYSVAQAAEGRTLFYDVCIACHADPYWKTNWVGKPLSDLYTTIRKYMPDDNPGTLTDRETAAALAYILESNGMPAGADPLPDDAQALSAIEIAAPAAKP